MSKFDEQPATNTVIMLFQCADESEVAKVMQVMQAPMTGLMLDGITVVMTRGEDE